jgi:hypothetical protein
MGGAAAARLLPGLLLGVSLGLLAGHRAAAADYCEYGAATAVLLVDRTTRFDTTDQAVFLEAAGALVDRLGAGDRLMALTMTDACKPACPEQGLLGDLFGACSDLAAQVRFRQFRASLAGALADLLRHPRDSPASDLFRTVADITASVGAANGPERPLRTLTVFSDLLENSSFLPEREFRRMTPTEGAARLAAADLRAKVAGAAVRVYGFGRDDGPARAALPQAERRSVAMIWERWFRDGGATSVVIGFR